MVAEIVANRQFFHSGAGVTAMPITNPGFTPGNLLVAIYVSVSATTTSTVPGFVLVASNTATASRISKIYIKIAGPNEPATYNNTGQPFSDIVFYEFSGVDLRTLTTALAGGAFGTLFTLPALTAAIADSAILYGTVNNNNIAGALTPPAGFTWEGINGLRQYAFKGEGLSPAVYGSYSVTFPAPNSSSSSVGVMLPAQVGSDAYRDLILSSGPAGYWRLDESSGDLLDSGGINPATANAGVTFNQPGVLGSNGAISLDGSSTSKAITATTPNLSSAPPFSIETWSFCTGAGFTGEPWDCIVGENGSVRMLINNGTGNVFVAANNTALVSGAGVAPLNQWNHIVYVADATTEYIYVNTVLVATRAKLSTPRFNVGPLVFGSYEIGTTTHYAFNGSVDEVAIYPYALSPAQISDHYLAAIGIPVENLLEITATCSSSIILNSQVSKTLSANSSPSVSVRRTAKKNLISVVNTLSTINLLGKIVPRKSSRINQGEIRTGGRTVMARTQGSRGKIRSFGRLNR